MSIKEQLVACYQGHGFGFIDACEYATQWLRELKQQPQGTTWTLGPNRDGLSVTVRRG